MERVIEPELMEDVEQAKAYASADFNEPHGHFIRLFQESFPKEEITGHVLDLGCGPGDITFRFARAYPKAKLIGIDGSIAMINLAERELLKHKDLSKRIQFVCGFIPKVEVPGSAYQAIISNSILHHLHDPRVLWDTILRHAGKGTKIFIMDLKRPSSKEEAKKLVRQYAGKEPEILQRDFYNSLLAAFTLDEVRTQLKIAGLLQLSIEEVSDRHLLVMGENHAKSN